MGLEPVGLPDMDTCDQGPWDAINNYLSVADIVVPQLY
jgi:hypothetical protein